MGLSRTTVYVDEDCALDGHSLLRESGGVCGWLEIGGYEVGVWGSPAAMRRLAAAVAAAADAADQMAEHEQHPEATGRAAL